MKKFVDSIVAFSLRHSLFIIIGAIFLLGAGLYSYIHTPIEAFPDVANTRGRVTIQWRRRSADVVEKFITLPIAKEHNTIAQKTDVRSISLFGLSVITVQFDVELDDFFAQQNVSNRLHNVDFPD